MNIEKIKECLKSFHFEDLFIEGLGWNQPKVQKKNLTLDKKQVACSYIAQVGGVPIIKLEQDRPQDKEKIKNIHKKIKEEHHKHLILFCNGMESFSLSYLSKDGQVRTYTYHKGQTGDNFISKLVYIHFGIEDGPDDISRIGKKLEKAFVRKDVTKKFYKVFKENHDNLQKYISGIDDKKEKEWYSSIILNRLMFIWFLQKKNFLNNDPDYLQNKLKESNQKGKDKYYSDFLQVLFFEGFAKKPIERSEKAQKTSWKN